MEHEERMNELEFQLEQLKRVKSGESKGNLLMEDSAHCSSRKLAVIWESQG